MLIVYDLESNKRRKILRCAEFKSHEVISIAFSHDSKYLLAQGSSPDFQLVYFFWEKGNPSTIKLLCLLAICNNKTKRLSNPLMSTFTILLLCLLQLDYLFLMVPFRKGYYHLKECFQLSWKCHWSQFPSQGSWHCLHYWKEYVQNV